MTIRTEWVAYGPEAAGRLRREVTAAKAEGALQPITVIVASNHVGVSTRRQLASGRLGLVNAHGVGMAAVNFLTVYRLAELLGNWEQLSRLAAVVAGRADWDRLLTEHAQRLESAAGVLAADPEQPPWKAPRLIDDAAAARDLRAFALGLIDDLETANTSPRAWPDHVAWARQLQARLTGGPAQQSQWAPSEQRAAERVDAALDRLAAIAGVEGPVTLEVFARTLRLVLDADLGRVGRLGEGILVGSVSMGVSLDLDLVVVLGMAEGSFPAVMTEDALLGDTERAASGGQLRSRRARVHEQHRQLLAALAGASQQVVSIPRGDLRRRAERVPSRWALDLASTIASERWWTRDLLDSTTDWVEHVASFDAGLRHTSLLATEQEYRLRALVAVGWDAEDGDDRPDPLRRQAGEVMAARRSDRFTRFDGHVTDGLVPSPVDRATSASRLEFLVTIVSGMSTKPQNRPAQAQVVFRPDGLVGYSLGSKVRTQEWKEWAPVDEQMAHDERIRLLYVACTRARDHLVVSLHRCARKDPPKASKRTNAELLVDGIGPELDQLPEIAPLPDAARPGIDPVAVAAPPPFGPWALQRDTALALASRPMAVAATAMTDDGVAGGAAPPARRWLPGPGNGLRPRRHRRYRPDGGRHRVVVPDP